MFVFFIIRIAKHTAHEKCYVILLLFIKFLFTHKLRHVGYVLQCFMILLLLNVTHQLKNKFMKKIPRDAEASNVLIGEVDFLDKPFVAFVRLAQATTLGGLTEVPVPTR